MKRIKRIIAMILSLVVLITAVPSTVLAVSDGDKKSASLSNLGLLGTVNIGNKTESGTWYKTKVDGNDVFCLDLGLACHTGYVYKAKISSISSDSSNKKNAIKAKIGHWYHVKKKKSNKAWVYAQCLIWGVEEGVTSESGLKDIISQVKKNTGYYSDDSIYSDIFDIEGTVTCEIITWDYDGKTDEDEVQTLMEIKSDKVDYDYNTVDAKMYYRQRITLHKNDEDGVGIPKVSFTIKVNNVKDLYSYAVNGWGDAVNDDVDSGAAKFSKTALTDSKGKITYRFTYLLTSKEYGYVKDDTLKVMTSDDKKKVKKDMDDDGIEYASDLTKAGAEKLYKEDLDAQFEKIKNTYVLTENSVENKNIVIDAQYAKGVTITLDKDDSWKKVNGEWPDTTSETYGAYKLAYQTTVINKFKKVKLTAVKKDSETGTPQGDATLKGAVYGVYSDEACSKLLNSYTTNDKGTFDTAYYRCGKTYYMKEITPPEGYLKNDKVYPIVADGEEFSVEYNAITKPVEEDIIKGRVSIIKGMGNGTACIVKPEARAKFQVYLASSGSYSAAKTTEKDLLTTDKEGFAQTKELPYGTYLVHQIDGVDETEFAPDFYVDVKKDGETCKYLLNNPEFTAYLKIVKKDSQTKKTVLKSNTTYQIYKLNDNGTEQLVTQKYNNGNKIVTVDKFVSDESGEIITYEKLSAGSYRVYEVEGPEGYKNDKKFVDVKITNKSYKVMKNEDGSEYLYAEYEYFNNETYGKFTVSKLGLSVNGFDDGKEDVPVLMSEIPVDITPIIPVNTSPFIYENITLNNVVFMLYAKEDITTQDNQGTTWFKKGDLVATITTGEGAEFTDNCNGICKYSVSKEGNVTINLPLGEYELKEVETKYGYILQENPSWDLKFEWKSQLDEYVFDTENTVDGTIEITNDLVDTDISIYKIDDKSNKPVPGAKFGFFTKDDIFDKDGNVVVAAGTKITTVETDENGYAKVPFSVPVMSEGYGSVDAPLNSGDYYFVEESVSDSYYIDETPVDVHVEYIDQETPVVNALATVTNTETEVQIDKLMIASSVEVDNCHLKICDTDGNEIVSWITGDKESIKVNDELFEMGYLNFDACIDENNSIKVKGLLHDKEYVLSETKPADGYVTASDITFKLVKNDVAPEDENVEPQTTQVMIKSGEEYTKADPNKVVMYDDTTKIEFSKLSITDGQELPGCKMKVTDKETGTVMDEWTSTEFSHMVEGKYVVGKTYILSETKPVDGYATSTDVEFTVLDDGKVQKVSMVDDTTKIEFSKIASDTKEQLKGAKYEVYNSKGKKVYEFKTGKKAELIEGVLKVGETYTFKEVDAPEHYKLAKDVNIKIKDTGKVQKLKAVDVRIPEVPDTPKTGNTTNTLLLALAALLTLMGTGCYACVRAKDKSKYRFKE